MPASATASKPKEVTKKKPTIDPAVDKATQELLDELTAAEKVVEGVRKKIADYGQGKSSRQLGKARTATHEAGQSLERAGRWIGRFRKQATNG